MTRSPPKHRARHQRAYTVSIHMIFPLVCMYIGYTNVMMIYASTSIDANLPDGGFSFRLSEYNKTANGWPLLVDRCFDLPRSLPYEG